jgi:hypothetical protein
MKRIKLFPNNSLKRKDVNPGNPLQERRHGAFAGNETCY